MGRATSDTRGRSEQERPELLLAVGAVVWLGGEMLMLQDNTALIPVVSR